MITHANHDGPADIGSDDILEVQGGSSNFREAIFSLIFSNFEVPYLGDGPADIGSDDILEVSGGRTNFKEVKSSF